MILWTHALPKYSRLIIPRFRPEPRFQRGNRKSQRNSWWLNMVKLTFNFTVTPWYTNRAIVTGWKFIVARGDPGALPHHQNRWSKPSQGPWRGRSRESTWQRGNWSTCCDFSMENGSWKAELLWAKNTFQFLNTRLGKLRCVLSWGLLHWAGFTEILHGSTQSEGASSSPFFLCNLCERTVKYCKWLYLAEKKTWSYTKPTWEATSSSSYLFCCAVFL